MQAEWLVDEDFASVHDPKSLERLPPEERAAWKKLWEEVRDLPDRSAAAADRPPAKE